MYLDLVSNACYGRYNRKFAQVVGLETAIYWSELMEILERVREKKTYDEDGYFTVNRDYIQKRTTLTAEQQLDCDDALNHLGIIEKDQKNKNRMLVNMKTFIGIITEEKISEITTITKVAKSSTRAAKAENKRIGIITRLQDGLDESDVDLLEAYKKWIESVYPKGMQTKAQVELFVKGVNNYSTDKQVKLGVISMATSLAYRECGWAIQMYERKFSKPSSITRNLDAPTKNINNIADVDSVDTTKIF